MFKRLKQDERGAALIETAITPADSDTVVIDKYPFSFMMLSPIVRMVTPGSTTGAAPLTTSSVAAMRNE